MQKNQKWKEEKPEQDGNKQGNTCIYKKIDLRLSRDQALKALEQANVAQ